ncbi:Crotonase superfamily [Corchorus capsularis]|uniref:3-hydroxyisobutyryl-CoA hydrolase n=1 Tax=Corchorus capsularis TaxID=210143 RepID=A0A1R3I687_COCAP|nr:Crotonase superfamily [Corchorus capsularis]
MMSLSYTLERVQHNQVLFEGDAWVKKVILNRPKKLNILSHEMICQMLTNFQAYEQDSTTNIVILKGNGRAFCAGGDVVSILSSMILGEYLGLSGARLDGMEMLACGLATHFVFSKDLVLLESELDKMGTSDTRKIVRQIDRFSCVPPLKLESAYARLDVINKCFSKDTVEEILFALKEMEHYKTEKWMIEAVKFMKAASPTSLKITLRSIREGRKQTLEQCLPREYITSCHIFRGSMNYNDLCEWQPPNLQSVSKEMVNGYFTEVDNPHCDILQLPNRSNLVQVEVLRSKI